jgi:hypothetical protein
MFERFSYQARLAVANARNLTRGELSQEICPRHFLWALLIYGTELPQHISAISIGDVLQQLGRAPELDGDPSVLLPLSKSSKLLLERSYDIAVTDAREMVDEWDLLIAAMWETEGPVWTALQHMIETHVNVPAATNRPLL